ncbi:cobalamin-binding domain-containing protein [candidate division CSSED10-310 bacterium]|uniref:Cobalamin-binding domain-containing protein n=1 Tax=candidate division CSSED10-310 bacterium TaxID=2855610 RepID=A0ABV6YSH9_UNCC1
MRKILLVEPAYRNKFPPLGLMKLSTYHKLRGDYISFEKGLNPAKKNQQWDIIYISTLFTFYWKATIKTIDYYLNSVKDKSNIVVGGITATLLGDELEMEFPGITVKRGLLNKRGDIDCANGIIIDELIPDYSLLDDIDYEYSLKDSYIAYATKGCPRRCKFCAVHRIEPDFIHYLPLKKQVICVDEIYGKKQDLILMDNNALASDKFEVIIADILDLGFERGAKLNGRKRIVDFNQGLDMRYVTDKKMQLLARTAIEPLRIAFDDISMQQQYEDTITCASKYGLLELSNYVLYNYKDTPEDFYQRLRVNVLLNEKLGTKIYSFPMKYIPLNAKDRTFVGRHWNKRIIRGIQCVLLATRGLISPKRPFFEAAFGKSYEEFLKIVYMPDEYIIYRRNHENNGAFEWRKTYSQLTSNQMNQFLEIISDNKIEEKDVVRQKSKRLKTILSHYIESKR